MNKKKESKDRYGKKRVIDNKDFFKVIPDNPPEDVWIDNSALFYKKPDRSDLVFPTILQN